MAKAVKAAKPKQQGRACPSIPSAPEAQVKPPAIGFEVDQIDPIAAAHLAERLNLPLDDVLPIVQCNRPRDCQKPLDNPDDTVQNRLLNADVPTEAERNHLRAKVHESENVNAEFVKQLMAMKVILDDIETHTGSICIHRLSSFVGRCIGHDDDRHMDWLPGYAQEWKKEYNELVMVGTESRKEIVDRLREYPEIQNPEPWLYLMGNLLHDLSKGHARELAFLSSELQTGEDAADQHRQRLNACLGIVNNIGIAVDAASKRWSNPEEFRWDVVVHAREMVEISDSEELAVWLCAKNASPASSLWIKG